MIEHWFDPNAYAWIPGTFYGTFCGIYGALAGILAPQGKAKTLVVLLGWIFFATAILFLATSVAAYFAGQPYGIWYGFGLPGLLGAILFPSLLPVVFLRYRQAEQRKLEASDL